MLLVIDVGNTNTVLGVFARVGKVQAGGEADDPPRYEKLVANWRVATSRRSTVDEYGVLFRNLFSMAGLESKGIHGIVVSSVVPPLDPILRQVCERYFNLRPLLIEPGVKTGMPVHYDNPAEVGADRIVNGVAAFDKYGGPCIIVDFGTATTFDCVSAKGEYLGGVICPGIGISADALFERTARLPRVEIRKPARVIGSNTVGSLQSGLYYGYIGLIDGIEEHQTRRRFFDAGRLAHYLGAECGLAKRCREGRQQDAEQAVEGADEIEERRWGGCGSYLPVQPLSERGQPAVENYFNYFTEIEDHFLRRRGGGLLLSTLDWALIETWKDAGIPLEAALRGIDSAFDKYDLRPSKTKKVNSLAYCSQEVLAAAEDMKEAAVGVSAGDVGTKPSAGQGFELETVAAFLQRNAEMIGSAKLPEGS